MPATIDTLKAEYDAAIEVTKTAQAAVRKAQEAVIAEVAEVHHVRTVTKGNEEPKLLVMFDAYEALTAAEDALNDAHEAENEAFKAWYALT